MTKAAPAGTTEVPDPWPVDPQQAGGSLAGLRVLDLTAYLPGPYAALLLADLGADVIHIEPPGGDAARGVAPTSGGDSALHRWVGRNKRSLVLNLKEPADLARLHSLVAACDVVLEGFRPGVAKRLGVDFDTCRGIRPDVVYCSISSFGATGAGVDLPGHDITYAARAGLLDQIRDEHGTPVPVGPPLVDLFGGAHAAVAVLAAVLHRVRTGAGQFVDVSLLGAAVTLATPQLVKAFAPEPLARTDDPNLGADPAYAVYATKDGKHIAVGALEPKFWERLCEALGRPDLVAARETRPAAVRRELATHFLRADRRHWDDLLDGLPVCYAPVNEPHEVACDRFVRQRAEIVTGAGGRQIAGPIRMSATPPQLHRPAPGLGET